MGKYRVCVYAICKNEEKFVDRWMDSMKEADLVVVTDTGSEDNTVERLRIRGAIVYEETISPWRFDIARNKSLSHVPDDIDIAVCTDLDEIFRPGWRKKLESSWTPQTTMANYLFNWSLNDDGTPNTQFRYFKVHKKDDYTWACPVHEYLKYIGPKQENKVFAEGVILDHYPDSTKSRSSYLPLLEMAVEEEPENDRMTYYLGREYMYLHRWKDCINTLIRHLSLPNATWAEERCASMRWIAKSYHELGDTRTSYSWYYRAIAELPNMRDPYVEFARLAYYTKDWLTCWYMSEKALEIKNKSNTYVNMGYSWDYTPEDLAAIACYWLKMYKESLVHAQNALEFAPDNERLIDNLKLIESKYSEISKL